MILINELYNLSSKEKIEECIEKLSKISVDDSFDNLLLVILKNDIRLQYSLSEENILLYLNDFNHIYNCKNKLNPECFYLLVEMISKIQLAFNLINKKISLRKIYHELIIETYKSSTFSFYKENKKMGFYYKNQSLILLYSIIFEFQDRFDPFYKDENIDSIYNILYPEIIDNFSRYKKIIKKIEYIKEWDHRYEFVY